MLGSAQLLEVINLKRTESLQDKGEGGGLVEDLHHPCLSKSWNHYCSESGLVGSLEEAALFIF